METLALLPAMGNIRFVFPYRTKAVSVTGGQCALNCAHCGGHYLQHMCPLESVAADDGSKSWLVSGGCRRGGGVPLVEHIDRLKERKRGRRYNVHTGMITKAEIDCLATVADCVSFDFVADETTIREVYGNGCKVEDYIACYRALRQKVRVVPHICLGLHGGKLRGEYRALELLEEIGLDSLAFIIFKPTKGTRYAGLKPPEPREVVDVLSQARHRFPAAMLLLGCMRPGGRYREEIDKWAVRIGIDSIVNPAPAAVNLARQMGLSISFGEECCVL
jgi:uncharacterized radical SAM superfamily protein